MSDADFDSNQAGFRVVPFPRMRQLVLDAGWLARRRHMIHGFIEVDVTRARQAIRDHEARTGETLSFTAFVVTCLGRAVGRRPARACLSQLA